MISICISAFRVLTCSTQALVPTSSFVHLQSKDDGMVQAGSLGGHRSTSLGNSNKEP